MGFGQQPLQQRGATFPEISGHFGRERIPFLTELLDPDRADLVFRDLGNGVKGWIGQDTCPTLQEVEGHED